MRTIVNLIMVCLFSAVIFAQEKPVKIVFDVTSGNTSIHESAVKHVKMMAPDSKFELAMYSVAYRMVVKGISTVSEQMRELGVIENVDLVVCQASLNRHKIEDTQLISGVRAVSDGILEIIQKQGLGWGYIKEAQ